jgi:circadian clock protein KaiC
MVSARTFTGSAETLLVHIKTLAKEHEALCVVIDPVSALAKSGNELTAHAVAERLVDWSKGAGVTLICTSLLDEISTDAQSRTPLQISTIADTWIHVSNIAREGERNRTLTIVKSRGTDHSNQVRELILSASGVDLVDVYVVEGEVLMGSARAQKESDTKRLTALAEIEARRRRLALERELAELHARVEAATLELGWKQQESELSNLMESERLTMQRDAAIQRLDLRRSGDDDIVVAPSKARGKKRRL